MKFGWLAILALTAVSQSLVAADTSYVWNLPKGFPRPRVPVDNPMSASKVELGRHLFYDTRLSANGKSSCSTCHQQSLAFTDGRPVAVGTTGQKHPRGSMSLVNVAYSAVLTWSNPGMTRLEFQALVPMFGEHPLELGLHRDDHTSALLQADHEYQKLFREAFPSEAKPYSFDNVTKALASFERSIVSVNSPYDHYHFGGDDTAVSESAKHGEVLFFSQPLSCFRCHGGFNFSDNTASAGHEVSDLEFHNNGLYKAYLPPNLGIAEFTGNPKDVGKFKAPTLRNIAVTAPYMHDGSIPSLEAVVDHYAAAGHDNPLKDQLIGGFRLSAQDKNDLINFLKSLTDDVVLHDPRFSNPWR